MEQNQTINKLRQMRLSAMADLHYQYMQTHQLQKFTADEYLALLAQHEWEDRQNKKTDRLRKTARFKQNAAIAEVDYSHVRNLDKNMFDRLGTLGFLKKKENIILTGPSGVGKSYLAQALGNQACLLGYKALYTNTARLLAKMKLSKVDGTYIKELKKLQGMNLLILDDFGLQAFDQHAREILMDIIDDRFDQNSTVVASQIPVANWYDLIGEGTIADASLS